MRQASNWSRLTLRPEYHEDRVAGSGHYELPPEAERRYPSCRTRTTDNSRQYFDTGLRVDRTTTDRRFDSFVGKHRRILLRFLHKHAANPQDAEDAEQESFMRLLRYIDTKPESSWSPLLFRIAANVVRDQRRRAVAHHAASQVSLDSVELCATTQSPESCAIRAQELARLSQAILELPPKCQRVYLLKRTYGLSHAQVAAKCGISVKMVEKHLATAMVLLKRKVGGSSSGTFY